MSFPVAPRAVGCECLANMCVEPCYTLVRSGCVCHPCFTGQEPRTRCSGLAEPICNGCSPRSSPWSTEVSLERRTRSHMGSSAVTAPAGAKLWELPFCTKTCPRQSLVEPRLLPALFRKLETGPRATARIPGVAVPGGTHTGHCPCRCSSTS